MKYPSMLRPAAAAGALLAASAAGAQTFESPRNIGTFDYPANGQFTIDDALCDSAAFDTVIALYDPNGDLVIQRDDNDTTQDNGCGLFGERNFRAGLAFRFGNDFPNARSFNLGSTNTYTIVLSNFFDAGENICGDRNGIFQILSRIVQYPNTLAEVPLIDPAAFDTCFGLDPTSSYVYEFGEASAPMNERVELTGPLPAATFVYFTFDLVSEAPTPPAEIIDIPVTLPTDGSTPFVSTLRSTVNFESLRYELATGLNFDGIRPGDPGGNLNPSLTEPGFITAIAGAGARFRQNFAVDAPNNSPGEVIYDVDGVEVFRTTLDPGEVIYVRFVPDVSPEALAEPEFGPLQTGLTQRDLAAPTGVFDSFDYFALYQDAADGFVFISLDQDGELNARDLRTYDVLFNLDRQAN